MHEILGDGDFVVGGPGKLKKVVVPGKVQEGELVSLRGGFTFSEFESELGVKVDGVVEVRDADAGVEELDHVDQ